MTLVNCHLCPKTGTFDLKRHISRVHESKAVTCVFCQKEFTRPDNLRDHLVRCVTNRKAKPVPKDITFNGDMETITCDFCHVEFNGCTLLYQNHIEQCFKLASQRIKKDLPPGTTIKPWGLPDVHELIAEEMPEIKIDMV